MEPAEIRKKARELEDEGLGGTSELMEEMMAYWKEYRPVMYATLQRQKVLMDFAMVQESAYHRATFRMMGEGMNPSDAAREAAPMLLMEPEEDDPPTEPEEEIIDFPMQTGSSAEASLSADGFGDRLSGDNTDALSNRAALVSAEVPQKHARPSSTSHEKTRTVRKRRIVG